ncbi:hypothetical protein SBA3_110004 [Candidatus Sulfopaludibacter sp. SbA3]|nr:hypothetical protein SBA3_110004 [Candidatus Sulfopaludibacter sp. SbA3]
MFRETIAKKCENNECELHGQMQDAGLPICPECAGDLTAATRMRYRLLALALTLLLLALGAGGAFAYGTVVRQLSPVQTVCWLTGRCAVAEGLALTQSRKQWLHGSILWKFKDGTEPKGFSRSWFCEQRGGAYWCRPRFVAANGDRFQFELYPEAENLYVLHRSASNSLRLYPEPGQNPSKEASPIAVPRHAEIELAGPATLETFAIVVSRRSLPELAGLPDAGSAGTRIEELMAPLSNDKDCLLLYVEIPHR